MPEEGWGFADIYGMDDERERDRGELEDVGSDDWRNVLVFGRATRDGVYPETLALVGRARYLADELGCRVEVLLVGEELDAATRVLEKYPVDTIYRVEAPGYAPIDHTAKLLEAVVRKRRPELVMVFQSRTGDALTAYAANRLGTGFVLGATAVDMDTAKRRAVVEHVALNEDFAITTRMQAMPQFVSVQRGLFRAPMEDPYTTTTAHDLDVDVGGLAAIEVLERRPPPEHTLADAPRVVVAGARVRDAEELEQARELARRLDAAFGVGRSLVDRGLAEPEEAVGELDTRIEPRLLVTVGAVGSLDFLEGIRGEPVICALASRADDPIAGRAAFRVEGAVGKVLGGMLDAL